MDAEGFSFTPRFCPCVDGALERLNEFGPAIRITAVVQNVGPVEKIEGAMDFAYRRSNGKKNQVPAGDIGDRNFFIRITGYTIFGDIEIGSEGRSAERGEINRKNHVRLYRKLSQNKLCLLELQSMPLTVVKT